LFKEKEALRRSDDPPERPDRSKWFPGPCRIRCEQRRQDRCERRRLHPTENLADLDADGYSQADEFKSLSDLGINAINTGYTDTSINDGNGNTQVQAGTFEKADSTTGQIGGFLLQRNTAYTIAEEWIDVPEAIALLPDLQGYGNVSKVAI